MLNFDDRANRDDVAQSSESSSGKPRYCRRVAQKVRELSDGDVARFQVGDSCFMILRIGSDLYVRPFGLGSVVKVNNVPLTGMTRLTLDDCLVVGRRSMLLRRPKVDETRSRERSRRGKVDDKPESEPEPPKHENPFRLPKPNFHR